MKKLATAITLIPIVVLGLIPPIPTVVPVTDKQLWLWLVLLSGFAGLYTLFLKINPFVKAFVIYSFIANFFSHAMFFSQFAYMELVACVYFYYACLQIKDWEVVTRVLYTILFVNIILIFMQVIGHDSVLNFGLAPYKNMSEFTHNHYSCSGTVGNLMQLKSFLFILTAILIQFIPRIEKWVKAIVVVLVVCGIYYFLQHDAWGKFLYARGPAWLEGLRLSFLHPFFGWGMGSFKVIFPVLGHGNFTYEGDWVNLHNDFLQVLFESGLIGFSILVSYVISVITRARKTLLLGCALVIFPLMFHFPMRQISAVPLLILFCALAERTIHGQQSIKD